MMILRSSEGLLQLIPRKPKTWNGKVLPGANLYSYDGKLGTVVLQEVVGKTFIQQYLHLSALQSFLLFAPLKKGWQSLISLKGKFPFAFRNQEDEIRDGQFIFFHGDETDDLQINVFKASHLQLWSTCYFPSLMERWLSLFPTLQTSDPASPFLLVPPTPARTGIIASIRDQFYEEYAPHLQKPYLQLKTEEQFFGLSSQAHDPAFGERAAPWERQKARQAWDLIMHDIRVHYTNEEIAAMIEVDRGALNRAFKLEYGLGMHQYLIRERMERSRELLLQGQPLKKVAELVGYKHSATFSYEFRKYYHYSPVDFQNGRIK